LHSGLKSLTNRGEFLIAFTNIFFWNHFKMSGSVVLAILGFWFGNVNRNVSSQIYPCLNRSIWIRREFRIWNLNNWVWAAHPARLKKGRCDPSAVCDNLSLTHTLSLFNYTKHKYIIRYNFWCRPSFLAWSKWISFKM